MNTDNFVNLCLATIIIICRTKRKMTNKRRDKETDDFESQLKEFSKRNVHNVGLVIENIFSSGTPLRLDSIWPRTASGKSLVIVGSTRPMGESRDNVTNAGIISACIIDRAQRVVSCGDRRLPL